MNLLLDVQILGWLLVGLGALQLVPCGAALVAGEPILPYAASAAAALVYGLPTALSVRPRDRRMRTRDGFLVVSAAWALASLFGAIPYLLAGVLSPVDALFESIAGFTTTGATVLTQIESTPKALLLWRSLSQWLGGMGIIVVTIAVLPVLGIGGMQLFKAEVPGPVPDKLTPRIAETARRLWYIYVGLTVIAFAMLFLLGMGAFDALCHALTTAATGGFSTRNTSIGAFASPAIEWVVIAFMLAAGTNFALHYRLVTGGGKRLLRDRELHTFLALIAGFTLVIAVTVQDPGHGDDAFRTALFQVTSLVTTTGYSTTDYELWPALARFLVLPMLVLGGMAGSTAGGLKTMRLILGASALRTLFLRVSHPAAVRTVRYSGKSVPDDVLSAVVVFFFAYFTVAAICATVVAAAGYDIVTSMSAALTAIGNVGPGLGEIGPTDHFAHFPAVVKLVLGFCMIAGRLELFTLLVILQPSFWRR